MPSLSRFFRLSGLTLLGLLAHGCSSGDEDVIRVAVIGSSAAPFESGKHLGLAARLVRSATSEGLVAHDDQGRVVPALAERWIVTDDGFSYVFRLRDGTWPDGSRISGESAAEGLRLAIKRQAGTVLGSDLAAIAQIIPRAGRVVEVQLSRADPDILTLLAQPELGLSHKGRGAGPMRLRREKDSAILRPLPPLDRGAPEIPDWADRSRKVQIDAMPASRAVERFREGDAAAILGGSFADYPLAQQIGLTRGTVIIDPVAGLFGLSVQRGHPFLGIADNREAVALAIDRDALADQLKAPGWSATTRIVAAGLDSVSESLGERWTGNDMDERRSEAMARVSNWQQGRKDVLRLRIALPSGPGADLLFARLAADLEAVGIKTARVEENAPADLRLVDQVARIARAAWFFNQLSCGAGRGLCSEEADELARAARKAATAQERLSYNVQAEIALTEANLFIPLGTPLRWSALQRGESGLAANRLAVHPLLSFALLPR